MTRQQLENKRDEYSEISDTKYSIERLSRKINDFKQEYNEKQKRKRIAELAFKIFIAPSDPNCGVIDTKAAFRVAEKFYEYEQRYLNGEANNEKD